MSEEPVFQVILSDGRIVNCECEWDRLFEGEELGYQYYRVHGSNRRCPAHGKPRHEKEGK